MRESDSDCRTFGRARANVRNVSLTAVEATRTDGASERGGGGGGSGGGAPPQRRRRLARVPIDRRRRHATSERRRHRPRWRRPPRPSDRGRSCASRGLLRAVALQRMTPLTAGPLTDTNAYSTHYTTTTVKQTKVLNFTTKTSPSPGL